MMKRTYFSLVRFIYLNKADDSELTTWSAASKEFDPQGSQNPTLNVGNLNWRLKWYVMIA
jgi:hypothetical protein